MSNASDVAHNIKRKRTRKPQREGASFAVSCAIEDAARGHCVDLRGWRDSERARFFRLADSELGLLPHHIDRKEDERRLTTYNHAIA